MTTYHRYLIRICLPFSNVLKVESLVLRSIVGGRESSVTDTSGIGFPLGLAPLGNFQFSLLLFSVYDVYPFPLSPLLS